MPLLGQLGRMCAPPRWPTIARPAARVVSARAFNFALPNCRACTRAIRAARVPAGEANPGYMIIECAKACRTCHLRDPKVRCKRNASEPQMLPPHAMGAMFRALEGGSLGAEYGPVRALSRSPWVVTLDNFLTHAEADAVLALVEEAAYERSANVGAMTELGRFTMSRDESRTSLNAWCNSSCAQAAVMREISRRVEAITGIPEANAEYMCAQREPRRRPNAHPL